MFRTSPVLSITLVPLILIGGAFAQSSRDLRPDAAIKPAGREKGARGQSRQVAAELERQQEFLRTVTSRFEAVALHDFTPLLQYSYVWIALRENRMRLERPVGRMSKDQTALLEEGYDALEKEVVTSFGDYQLSILNDVLELNDLQFQDVQKAVDDDLSSRRDLLKTKDLTATDFALKLNVVSANTESRILSILFPEQRKVFDRQLNFNRDRLVG